MLAKRTKADRPVDARQPAAVVGDVHDDGELRPVEADAAAAAVADVAVDAVRAVVAAAAEAASWPPGEAGRGEEPTLVDWLDYGSVGASGAVGKVGPGRRGEEKAGTLRVVSGGHGRTCSRKKLAA